MSGYQRMVSYLYRYDKGIKGKNTGYARIERNDRRCRVTIRLQDTVSVSPSVFFFIQNDDSVLHNSPFILLILVFLCFLGQNTQKQSCSVSC